MGTTGLALAVAPALLWLAHVRRKDRHEREPWALLVLVLLLGAASAFLIGWARPRVEHLASARLGLDSAWAEAYLVTALPEELAKLAAVAGGALWLREWDEPSDGIVYGAAAALGFACVENVYYLLESRSLAVVVARTFTADLGHVVFTSSGAFLLGLSKLARPATAWFALGGVVCAALLHGTYDLLLGSGGVAAVLALVLLLPLGLLLLAAKLRWALARSPHRAGRPASDGSSGA